MSQEPCFVGHHVTPTHLTCGLSSCSFHASVFGMAMGSRLTLAPKHLEEMYMNMAAESSLKLN